MDAIAVLNRMPHMAVNDEPYLKNKDARFVIEQLIDEYEVKGDSKLKSSRQILGYIDGLFEGLNDASEDDPRIGILRDIRCYITMSIDEP